MAYIAYHYYKYQLKNLWVCFLYDGPKNKIS